MFDLVIRGGTIIDGTGAEPFVADVAIKDGKIAAVGSALSGAEEINASGLVVTPGFIDSHSHSDKDFLIRADQKEKVEQGITTCIAGQCGNSPAPKVCTDGACYTMGQFLQEASSIPQGCNAMTFVGHKSLRLTVLGNDNRTPTKEELERMKELLVDGMEHGAIGISFGLMYAPSCFAETEELVALAETAKRCGGMVSAHIRNEGERVVEAVEEFIQILRLSGARGVYSHHKACGRENHGKVHRTMALLEAAVAEGIEIWCDAYPYTASSTSLAAAFIPKEYRAGTDEDITNALNDPAVREQMRRQNIRRWGEGLSWVLVTRCSSFPEYSGMTIPQIAEIRGQDGYDAVFDIVRDSRTQNKACFFSMSEEDVMYVLAHPRTMICTDSAVAGGATLYHPRLRGSFPRVLGRYVRQKKITSLPEMIRKMTSLPAAVYGIDGKGVIAKGFDADICVFDPDRILDHADFVHCSEGCEGLNYVLVNGQIAALNGVHTGRRDGKLLLR